MFENAPKIGGRVVSPNTAKPYTSDVIQQVQSRQPFTCFYSADEDLRKWLMSIVKLINEGFLIKFELTSTPRCFVWFLFLYQVVQDQYFCFVIQF